MNRGPMSSLGAIKKSSSTEILLDARECLLEDEFLLVQDGSLPRCLLAEVVELTQRPKGATCRAIILGEIIGKEIHRCRYPPSPEAKVYRTPPGLVSDLFSYGEDDGIFLGQLATVPEDFRLDPSFVERHALIIATTGAGKSYAAAVLLEELMLKTDLDIVVFDIHGEYWGLSLPNDGPESSQLSSLNLKPLGFEKKTQIIDPATFLLPDVFDRNRLRRLTDLTTVQENTLTCMTDDRFTLEQLIDRIETSDIASQTRTALMSKVRALIATGLFANVPGAAKELDSIEPSAKIVQLGRLLDERSRHILVNDFLYTLYMLRIDQERGVSRPCVVVIEEAHRFSGTKGSPDTLELVAREGRKFGIYLILVTQRPRDLSSNVIANINTLIALRTVSDTDLSKIKALESVSNDIITRLPRLSKGQGLIAGEQSIAGQPVLIQIRPRLSKHIDPKVDVMPEHLLDTAREPETLKVQKTVQVERFSPHRIYKSDTIGAYQAEISTIAPSQVIDILRRQPLPLLNFDLINDILKREFQYTRQIPVDEATSSFSTYSFAQLDRRLQTCAYITYEGENPLGGPVLHLRGSNSTRETVTLAKISKEKIIGLQVAS